MRLSAGIAALVFVLLALTSLTGHSQPKCAFTHYSVEDGLSEGVALTMHQDREGLMWFGTFDGLNRFDGYSFKVYKSGFNSGYGLTNNTFTYEITDFVKYGESNSINVICDNSLNFDVAPQGGDFNMYGGLYRDVWLIVTGDDACISPLLYSSAGVFIRKLHVSDKRAELRADIFLSAKSDYDSCEVEFSILDKDNKIVSSQTTPYVNNDKGLVSFDRTHRKDAFYLYKANWNKEEKTTHLCSKEYTERKEDITDIIAFTTAPSARLFINGKQVGKMDTDQYATVIWRNIKLSPGKNHVEIKTADGTDSVNWTVLQ